jgi:predicted PurR-regulated permease PerM
MFAEIFLMIILSDKEYHRKNLLVVVSSITAFVVIVFVLQGTSFGKYVLLQITSLIDSFLHTQLSVKYGGDTTQLGQSASYRKLLQQVFHVSWLNPILGIGRKRAFSSEINGLVVQSIDNFYIAEYIRYAYPGMLSYIAIIIYMLYKMLKDAFQTRSALIRTLFIGTVCYCMHLYIADSLQTLKYLYVLFALFICSDKTPFIPQEKGKYFGKRESKYVRK